MRPRAPGETADDVIHAQDSHLKEAVAGGDDTHRDALQEMKGRWKRPWTGLKWYKNTKREFAALPEVEPGPAPGAQPA